MIFLALSYVAWIFLAIYIAVLFIFLLPSRTVKEKKNLPFVSVIIATKNEENVIEKTLRALRTMDYPRFEIIVVDSSSDKTPKIAKKYADRVIEIEARGKPNALNAAAAKAKGEILYILDADSVVESGTLRKLVHALDDEYEAAVGLNLPENSENVIAYVGRLELGFLSSVNRVMNRFVKAAIIPGRNYVIYKKTLLNAGGFENVLTEDVNISWRLYTKGKKIDFVHAVCREQVPDHTKWYVKQQERWSAGVVHEMRSAFGNLSLRDKLIFLPCTALLGLLPHAAAVSIILFALSQYMIFFWLFALSLFVLFLSAVKYLDARDIALSPFIGVVYAFSQLFVLFYTAGRHLAGKKTVWTKTPKEVIK